MRVRTRLLLAALIALRPAPDPAADPDGDGRYQRVLWIGADAEGAPTTLHLYVGTSDSACKDFEVRIAAPGEGGIGMFARTAPGLLDSLDNLFSQKQPMVNWDLSTYPPGTVFTITTRYLDAKGGVIDEETMTTRRPMGPAGDGGGR
jgi:hypothetical protein